MAVQTNLIQSNRQLGRVVIIPDDIAARALDGGPLVVVRLYNDGEPVAAQFWTVEQGTAYIHKLAHLPSAEPLSPGTTLTAALMEQVIDHDKVAHVDFGTGNDRYKADWMEQVRPRYALTCLRPGNPRHWPELARWTIAKLVSRRPAG